MAYLKHVYHSKVLVMIGGLKIISVTRLYLLITSPEKNQNTVLRLRLYFYQTVISNRHFCNGLMERKLRKGVVLL